MILDHQVCNNSTGQHLLEYEATTESKKVDVETTNDDFIFGD
jgi:hypothetical protein